MKLVRFKTADDVIHIGDLDGRSIHPLRQARGNGQEEILEIAMTGERPPPLAAPFEVEAVEILVPIPVPPSLRDFLTFERHFELMLGDADGNLPSAWYDFPAFYFTSPHDVIATGGTVEPPKTKKLDYELEVAVVVGKDGRNLTREQAIDHIAGYVLFNDFSARDIQSIEMPIGLGPSKCKDFGGALGPALVTPEEMPGQPGRPTGILRATVNGRLYSEGELGDMRYDFAQLIAHASTDSYVRAGDVLGSGTCSTGCIAELVKTHGEAAYPWLQSGDVVELSHDVLGVLTTTVGGVA
jgi:2-keto-4-pentenoate hydratase/2-oxohepta-3-ene-1,7-dioic acid hydratase in catechol pathway